MEKRGSSTDPNDAAQPDQPAPAQKATAAPRAIDHVIEHLADGIITRIATDLRRQPRFDNPVVREADLCAFFVTLLQPTADAARQFLADRRAEGMSRQAVYLSYICDAARRLGDGWDQDRLSFMEVTLSIGHLFALMRALRAEVALETVPYDPRRCAMFATVPGDNHCIGVTVAAALFREVGWTIDLQTGTAHVDLAAHIQRSQPPVIGLSLSTNQSLPALVKLVSAVRQDQPQVIIGVACGPGVDRKRLARMTDVDLLFDDARLACVELDRLIRLRSTPSQAMRP